jgi:hypothetical protein
MTRTGAAMLSSYWGIETAAANQMQQHNGKSTRYHTNKSKYSNQAYLEAHTKHIE